MGRRPRQRELIQGVFEKLRRPLTAQEVFDHARLESRTLGIATAYRAVNKLVEDGLLNIIQLPGEAARYELADQPHHHYFHCNGCEQVYSIEACPGNLKKMVPEGYDLESHEVVLYGKCASCNN